MATDIHIHALPRRLADITMIYPEGVLLYDQPSSTIYIGDGRTAGGIPLGEKAYRLWLVDNPDGTVEDYLASLKGADGKNFTVDATGVLADLINYNAEPKGFAYLTTDTGVIYIKEDDLSGAWSAGIPFRGPEGPAGAAGAAGEDGADGADGADGDITNPMTTAGDIIVGGADGAPARLAKGADGKVLGVESGAVAWVTPTGGGGGLVMEEVTATAIDVEDGKLYVANATTQIVFKLPADISNIHFGIIGLDKPYNIISNSSATTQKITYRSSGSTSSFNSGVNLVTGSGRSFGEFYGISSAELVASIFDNIIFVESARGFSYGTNKIEALTFATETNANIAATIAVPTSVMGGFNSAENGYAGWIQSSIQFEKFNFETEVNSKVGSLGGEGTAAGSSIIEGKGLFRRPTDMIKVVFATDSNSSIASGLANAKWGPGGCSSPSKFYVMGTTGDDGPVSCMTFDTEVHEVLSINVIGKANDGAGGGNATDGYSRLKQTVLNKIHYSDETISALAATLPSNQSGGAVTNSESKLYIHGGGSSTVIRSIDFSDDSLSTTSAALSSNRSYTAGFQSGGLV